MAVSELSGCRCRSPWWCLSGWGCPADGVCRADCLACPGHSLEPPAHAEAPEDACIATCPALSVAVPPAGPAAAVAGCERVPVGGRCEVPVVHGSCGVGRQAYTSAGPDPGQFVTHAACTDGGAWRVRGGSGLDSDDLSLLACAPVEAECTCQAADTGNDCGYQCSTRTSPAVTAFNVDAAFDPDEEFGSGWTYSGAARELTSADGRFVSGVGGEQMARPHSVLARPAPTDPGKTVVTFHVAADAPLRPEVVDVVVILDTPAVSHTAAGVRLPAGPAATVRVVVPARCADVMYVFFARGDLKSVTVVPQLDCPPEDD